MNRYRSYGERLFVLAGDSGGTAHRVGQHLVSVEHFMFGTQQQAVFSVTRNIPGNGKQLARKGVESSSEVVAF